MDSLPIDALLPEIRRNLAVQTALVIEASPGAGKSTRVPLALLEAPWLAGRKLVMLEPRRLAARAVAGQMARLLGEALGQTVGYRVRLDSRIGPHTRIEVVTEGVLTRLLQADPALAGYGAVIFDEFHERSLHADLALALCLDARQALRPDLRLLVMSATLDGERVSALLGQASRVQAVGRSFPVTTRYLSPAPTTRMEAVVTQAVQQVLREESGSVLVFLPGGAEIRRVANRLAQSLPDDVSLLPLYGDLPQAQQDAALHPAARGRRKLVLATSIAETSLTIEGVRVVVDAGWTRSPRFDPVSGMTRLTTRRLSRASAEQRQGRAGRLEPGVCYRLWSEGERLEAQATPEILQADLAPLLLELALWGVTDVSTLAWLDMPPAAAVSQARDVLRQLALLDADGRITAHGRRAAALPLSPRLAHMVLRGAEQGRGWLACLIAALLSERDILRGPAAPADIGARLSLLSAAQPAQAQDAGLRRVHAVARDIAHMAGIQTDRNVEAGRAGALLALAYPDRIAQRRPGSLPRYVLANGRGAYLSEHDALGAAPWLAVAALDGVVQEARIFLAAPLDQAEFADLFSDQIESRAVIAWDERTAAVTSIQETRLGALLLVQRPLPAPDSTRVEELLLAAIRKHGLEVLPWDVAAWQWQARVSLLRRVLGSAWPAVDEAALLATLEQWLAPYLTGKSRFSHLADVPLQQALHGLLDYHRQRELETLAPTHVTVPSGSRIAVDYLSGDEPVLAVRLQELFGLGETPSIVQGRVPLLLHLLSPARRPVQVTRDLGGFWRGSYQEVRKDLRGRYPKHVWPEDPLQAAPRRGTGRGHKVKDPG